MDSWHIADALLRGRDIPSAKLHTIGRHGDHADALYVRLFEVISGRLIISDVHRAVRDTCPHEIVEAWVYIFEYSKSPTRRNLIGLADAVHEVGPLSGIVMRLSRLVLIGSHRKTFANIIECAAVENPFLESDLSGVLLDLKTRVGPARLIVKRDKLRNRSYGDTR